MGHNSFQLGVGKKQTVIGGYSQTEGQLFGIETFSDGQGNAKNPPKQLSLLLIVFLQIFRMDKIRFS